MQGAIRCIVIAGLLVGCDGENTDRPDADASMGSGGLVLAWSSLPAEWPADLGDNVSLEGATFAFDSLRVVGDAGPGDPRTTANGFTVGWDDVTQPMDIGFTDAPTGLYSQLSLLIDGHLAVASIELRGHVRVNSVDYEFRISDDSPFSRTLDMDTTLTPPATARVQVRVDFDHALEAIDFATLDNDGGRLELDTSDPQMPGFRDKLGESFHVIAPL